MWCAQAIRRKPLADVLSQLAGLTVRSRSIALEQVVCATLRAGHFGARRLGWLDSCLTRSLVAAALSQGREDVRIHIGFQDAQDDRPDTGHAWVTVGAALLLDDHDPAQPDRPYRTVLELRLDEYT